MMFFVVINVHVEDNADVHYNNKIRDCIKETLEQ